MSLLAKSSPRNIPTAGQSPMQVDYWGAKFKPSMNTESSVLTFTYRLNKSFVIGFREGLLHAARTDPFFLFRSITHSGLTLRADST